MNNTKITERQRYKRDHALEAAAATAAPLSSSLRPTSLKPKASTNRKTRLTNVVFDALRMSYRHDINLLVVLPISYLGIGHEPST